ncbi:hypothetical protein R3P38DRAFT_2801000 [Favolaschia claudopus]|uniref:Uncharacterized protein n=1 Tax=Favolaschia claudopus TaxID=2862362 RepID=A0AAV9ZX15_9AGAR
MGKRKAHVAARLANFTKGLVEKLSPRKRRKVEKENEPPTRSPAPLAAQLGALPHNDSDVFLSPPRSKTTFSTFFQSTAPTETPLCAPDYSFGITRLGNCELNFIEQCWGYAKRIYRLNPESSRADVLEKNALAALDAVPLLSMRRFAIRSERFMYAYTVGLTGSEAVWAARRYRGHRTIPLRVMDDMEVAGVRPKGTTRPQI